MKMFEFFDEDFKPYNQKDFKEIKKYLDSRGIINNISDRRLDYLYSDFSEDRYAAGWMGIVSDYDGSIDYKLLDEFVHWLSNKSI